LVTNDFPLFDVKAERLSPGNLQWLCRTASFVELCQRASEGTTNRVRLKEGEFIALEVPLPPLPEQQRIVARIDDASSEILRGMGLRKHADFDADALMAASRRAFLSALLADVVPLQNLCTAIIDNLHRNCITSRPVFRVFDHPT
jgi:type I restriction enzyme S subunit